MLRRLIILFAVLNSLVRNLTLRLESPISELSSVLLIGDSHELHIC
jgi:hypothetical protein